MTTMFPKDRKAVDELYRTDPGFTPVLKRLGIESPRCGADVNPGWRPIVEKCLEQMIAAGWDKELHQIKQKFCQLRVYIGKGEYVFDPTGNIARDDQGNWLMTPIGEAINSASDECDKTCELCGKERFAPGLGMGWALCTDCGEVEKR